MDIGTLTGAIEIEDQATDVFTHVLHKAKEFAEEMDGWLGATAIGVGVVTAAVLGMAASIEHLGTEGSVINGVEDAFDRLAKQVGSTGEELFTGLNEGVKATV